MRAVLLASATVAERSWAWRAHGGGWQVATPAAELLAFDALLRPLGRFELPSAWRGQHAVRGDLGCAAVSERDRVVMLDAASRVRWELGHAPWGSGDSESGSCAFDGSGRHVFATVPGGDGPDRWWAIDAETGALLAEAPLACWAAGSHVVAHPDGEHLGLSVGEGQDAARVYWGRLSGRSLHVVHPEDLTRVLVAVHPDGETYLTTPHGSGGEWIATHRFPSGAVVAWRAPEEVLGDDRFGLLAGYLDAGRVLVAGEARTDHVVLAAADLSPLGTVEYPDAAAGGRSLLPTGEGSWLTFDYPSGRLQLWSAP